MEARVIAGRYGLIRPLGRGGMGAVWLGEDELTGRQVAVKELRAPDGAAEADRDVFRKRALQEARSAARLAHPNAVTLHDVIPASPADDAVYLIMEYVDGATLAQVIQRDGPLSEQRAAGIARQLLSILAAAHALGIVHRDIKPANIMISAGGQVKLTDFGIAHTVGGTRLTGSGVIGTPAYMAPEQLQGLDITPAVDLWALGVTLYDAVTGRNPFDRQNTAATFHAILMADLPAPACAPPLGTVIAGLLVRDPDSRMTGAQAQALLSGNGPATQPGSLPYAADRAGSGGQWPPPAHPATIAARPRGPGRRRPVLIILGACVAAAAILAVVAALQPDQTAGRTGAGDPPASSAPASTAAAAAAPTAPASTAPASTVPAAYLGQWHGTLADNTGLEGPQAADLTLAGGAVGSVVGTVSYPTVGCGYDLRLLSATASQVELYEQVTSGSCISEYVVLATTGGGLSENVYQTPPNGGQPDFAGSLTKGAAG